MADIERTAEATWTGDLRGGQGQISSASGVLHGVPYSFATRFEQARGTNPEELIAAAHAACYSMALTATLVRQRHQPQRVQTRAVCTLAPQPGGGFKITGMRLETRAQVPGLDETTLREIAQQAEAACPVSNALRSGVPIELHASLG